MKQFSFLLIIIFSIGVYSCDKDTDEFSIVYSGYLISNHEIKIFSKDGEITNPELKYKINQENKYHGRDFEDTLYQKEFIAIHISKAKYLSDNSVEITIKNKIEDKPRTVYKTDSLVYWEKQDITEYVASQYGYPYNLDVNKLKPLFYDITSNNNIVRVKECYYVTEKNGELMIPMYEYKLKYYNGGIYNYSYSYPINNEFNESCISSIGNTDTLVVQKYFIKLKRNI